MNSLTLTTNYYHEHRDEIVNFVAMRIQDKAEAEDIVQDLFLCLLDGHRVITRADFALPGVHHGASHGGRLLSPAPCRRALRALYP